MGVVLDRAFVNISHWTFSERWIVDCFLDLYFLTKSDRLCPPRHSLATFFAF